MPPTAQETFDRYARSYDDVLRQHLGAFGRNIDYYAEYKVRFVRQRTRGEPRRILEYGCGTGRNFPFLRRCFPAAELHGCDISEASLDEARRVAPDGRFFAAGGPGLRGSFDLVFVACTLHHIPVADRAGAMQQAADFLRAGGAMFLFEENPYNPLTRRVMRACPFDADSVMLTSAQAVALARGAGLSVVACRYTLFFPVALRAFRFVEPALGRLPLGAQYCVQARRR
jgi:SAM-dependent methyltransferase